MVKDIILHLECIRKTAVILLNCLQIFRIVIKYESENVTKSFKVTV